MIFVLYFLVFQKGSNDDFHQDFLRQLRFDLTQNDNFIQSNKRASVNGFMFGNLKFQVKRGQKTRFVVFDLRFFLQIFLFRWYVSGVGGKCDTYTIYWHGNSVM